jgi:hypothetical protein
VHQQYRALCLPVFGENHLCHHFGVIFVFLDLPYIFIPIQLTLISAVTIGTPAFSGPEPNYDRVEGQFPLHHYPPRSSRRAHHRVQRPSDRAFGIFFAAFP